MFFKIWYSMAGLGPEYSVLVLVVLEYLILVLVLVLVLMPLQTEVLVLVLVLMTMYSVLARVLDEYQLQKSDVFCYSLDCHCKMFI